MSLESDMQKYHPLAMQKEAEELALRCDRQKKEKIQFLLIGEKIPRPVECVWLDPCFGFFQVAGHTDSGFIRIKDLPAGTMILNQRVEAGE